MKAIVILSLFVEITALGNPMTKVIETKLYNNCTKKSTSKIDMNTTVNFCNCYAKGAAKAVLTESEAKIDSALAAISEACKRRHLDGKGK